MATAQNEHMACGLSTSTAELDFVARTLAATIQACAVEYSEAGLTNAARMLRSVYRRAFNGSGAAEIR